MHKFSMVIVLAFLSINKSATGLNFVGNSIIDSKVDTSFVMAEVTEIDTMDYYVVIRAIAENKQKLTILSQRKGNNADTIAMPGNGQLVEVGHSYNFALTTLNRIQYGENNYFFINLRQFTFNGKHFLDAGELPYLALNMYKYTIYLVDKPGKME